MLLYRDLKKRSFRFYEKNTYREIENGDIGDKIYLTSLIGVKSSLKISLSIREPINASFILKSKFNAEIAVIKAVKSNITSNTEFNSKPLLEQFKITTLNNKTTIKSEISIINTYKVQNTIKSNSKLKATSTLIFTPNVKFPIKATIEIEKMIFIDYKRDKSINVNALIEKEFNIDVIIPSVNLYYSDMITSFYEVEVVLLNYDRDYKKYSSLENKTFKELSFKDYANLSYRKIPLIERSVIFNV